MSDLTNYSYKKYDAILLAGEGESSYNVFHQHKAFLEIKGSIINSPKNSPQKKLDKNIPYPKKPPKDLKYNLFIIISWKSIWI